MSPAAPAEGVPPPAWHTMTAAAVVAALQTDPTRGLTAAQATTRLAQDGPNTLPADPGRSLVRMVIDQLADPMIALLVAAAAISGIVGEPADAIVITVIVLLNAVIGLVQERRAERAMSALRAMSAPAAIVVRDGQEQTIPAADVVPGDLVALRDGAIVPADLRLITTAALRISEAALTGESQPVGKRVEPVGDPQAALGDRRSMAFRGTLVAQGRGLGVAVATGRRTQLGGIAGLLASAEDVRTPLQRRLARFGGWIALTVVGVCAVVFATGLLRGEEPGLMFLTAVSLAVAAVPEALPAVVAITLALGARRMAERKALARRLPAVEALGSVTWICSDKTGTLTENRMRAEVVEPLADAGAVDPTDSTGTPGTTDSTGTPGTTDSTGTPGTTDSTGTPGTTDSAGTPGTTDRAGGAGTTDSADGAGTASHVAAEPGGTASGSSGTAPGTAAAVRPIAIPAALLEVLVLCNDARLGPDPTGDPTEIAMLEAARARGIDPEALRRTSPRIAELPFDPATKLMATFHPTEGGTRVLVKGAPEAVIATCDLSHEAARTALERCAALASQGLRVLVAAHASFEGPPTRDESGLPQIPTGLTLLGLVGLIDPPRPEARGAVAQCRAAGIVPVMITGDHPATAAAIARRLGILDDEMAEVLTGPDLAGLGDQELAAAVRDIRVYARVDPGQKIRIVRALQADGQFVAMTGDGVNDAPALRQAEIGVAMGRDGTDVAREAAGIVLLDDRFATIVTAVREGRRIYDDIRKFIRYALAGNSGEIWTVFLAPFLGMPVPLLPIHILWINLVTDGLPGLALAEEPAERDVMNRPPRPPREGIFARGLGAHVIWVGLLIGAIALGTQAWGLAHEVAQWQSMVFTVLVFSQLVHALAIRSETQSLLAIGLATNPMLLGAVALTVGLQLALLYVPWLQRTFQTVPLTGGQLAAVLTLPLLVLVGVELEKLLVRRGILTYSKRS